MNALSRRLNRPPEVVQLAMFDQLKEAATQHPERVEFDRLVTMGHKPDRADHRLAYNPPITLKQGRASYKLRNTPGRLEALAVIVAKAPCWNGRKTPKPRSAAVAGEYYYHPRGFRLWVPITMSRDSEVCIGKVTLQMTTNANGGGSLLGAIPDAWMVDLNEDSACVCETTP